MTEPEFKKEKKAIWAKYERDLCRSIPAVIRIIVENGILLIDRDEYLEDLDADIKGKLELIRYILDNSDIPPAAIKTGNKKRYPKAFEKAVHLVDFVTPYNTDNLKSRSFEPHIRVKSWKEVSQSWNKKHRFDKITPSTLKREYYRAIRDEDIKQEYFRRKEEIIRFCFEPLKEAIDDLQRRSHPMRELVQRVMNEQQLITVLKARILQLEIIEKEAK